MSTKTNQPSSKPDANTTGNSTELPSNFIRSQIDVDLAAGKIKTRQFFVGREPRGLELIGDGADFALGHLGFEQLREDRHGRIERRCTLFDQIADGSCHAIHLEAAQHDHHGGTGGVMTHGASP